MADHKISWLNIPGYKGETWNPIVGCSKCSPGCANCYAEKMAFRQTQMRTGCEYCDVIDPATHRWNGKTAFVESALDKPLHWKSPRVIFVCSMSDIFHESIPFKWVDKIMAVAARYPQHKFLLLTKRPKRMAEYFTARNECFEGFPLPNVGIGVTVCTQAEADEKIPVLLSIPAAMRFVSIEPMLERIILPEETKYCETCGLHFDPVDIKTTVTKHDGKKETYTETYCKRCHEIDPEYGSTVVGSHIGLDWVLLGGESGHRASPMHPDWARGVQKQCADAGVPFLFKQWGSSSQYHNLSALEGQALIESGWNPAAKNGGNLLDGKEYHQFPKFFKR